MRRFIGGGHRSVRCIINALNQAVSLPWEPTRRYGWFSNDFTVFTGMVSGFLNASIDLEMMRDAELDGVLKHLIDSGEELSASYSPEALAALSERGTCFFRSAEAYFQHCFLEYPPDRRVWFTDTALGLSVMIAQQLFPAEAVASVR
ncbi:MAG: hypothetical protein KA731_00960 [Candidatus Moranbacteria bacterium]|nr:hypothetical protein [Candidatus Moranbacteria bacterium]MBP6034030.1 hypothetical protein [Candidatus Moranbacteria bacterium]